MTNTAQSQRGMALVAVLLATIVLSTLGVALVLTTTAETRIAANFRGAQQALYAAGAGAARALDDLQPVADWNLLLNGGVASSFTDGSPGVRRLDDGSTLDLRDVVNLANCQKASGCSDSDMNAATDDRPWGVNNPRWRLFAYGRLRDLLPPDRVEAPEYVVVMTGDDSSETDNDPAKDGAKGMAGSGIVAVRAEAFGPLQSHKVVELTVAHGDHAIRVLSWREIR